MEDPKGASPIDSSSVALASAPRDGAALATEASQPQSQNEMEKEIEKGQQAIKEASQKPAGGFLLIQNLFLLVNLIC